MGINPRGHHLLLFYTSTDCFRIKLDDTETVSYLRAFGLKWVRRTVLRDMTMFAQFDLK